MFYIYMHENKENHKKYIGQTCQKLKDRWHNGLGYVNCKRFYSAIQCYGWDNFNHIVLEEVETQEEANEREQYYIKFYNTMDIDFGYNLVEGGSSLKAYWSKEENRKLQSERKKEYFKNNPDKKIENDKHLQKIAVDSAEIRSQKMKENYKDSHFYNINEKRKYKFQCIETGEIFNSLKDAVQKYGSTIGNLSTHINHPDKRKSCGKDPDGNPLHWKRI